MSQPFSGLGVGWGWDSLLLAHKFSHVMPSVYFRLDLLLCFVGEQVGFIVLVFGPAGPDIEPQSWTKVLRQFRKTNAFEQNFELD